MNAEKPESLMADVLGITQTDDEIMALGQGLETLGYDVYDPIYAQMATTPPGTNRLFSEVSVDVDSIKSFLNGEISWSSTMNDWPTYQYMVRNFGRKSSSGGTALLIGAMSALSSRSFVRLAEEEYGVDRTCVIDLFATQPKARHSNFFARASGLNLPFASGSVDVVHTNRLIHALKNPSTPSDAPLDMVPKLAEEVARVLAPGGQLFMYETIPDYKKIETPKEGIEKALSIGSHVASLLKQSGLETAHVLPGSPISRAEDLFDPKRNFREHLRGVEINQITFGIYGAAKR